MNLKVLQLEEWMKMLHDDRHSVNYSKLYDEIAPIIGRDGLYRYGKESWFEVDGRAYVYSVKDFEYVLKMFNHRPLRDNEEKLLKEVLRSGILHGTSRKEVVELLEIDKSWKQTSRVVGSAVVHSKRFKLRLKKKKVALLARKSLKV